MSTPLHLFNSYTYQEVSEIAFNAFYAQHSDEIYSDIIYLDSKIDLSEQAKKKQKELSELISQRQTFFFFILYKEEVIGWHSGYQISGEEYFMLDSGILKAHQNKGVYQAFLKAVIAFLSQQGYQFISSKHHASNNAVLVPKLKAGFVIQSLEINIDLGIMVKLVYFVNEAARNSYNYRTGSHPLPEMKAK